MHKDWRTLGTPHERLAWAREKAGYESAADAAAALGMTGSRASTYFGHENGSRGLSRAGARYADFFGVSLDWLTRNKGAPTPALARHAASSQSAGQTNNDVPILGRVGAGPEGSVEFSDHHGRLGAAPRPPAASETTVALEVWGGSMRPLAFDGWLIYYDDRKSAVTPEMIGQPCVLALEGGHTVIKIPYRGSKRGLWHLESINPAVETMRDRRIRWAAAVTAIVPRKSAQRLGGDIAGSATV